MQTKEKQRKTYYNMSGDSMQTKEKQRKTYYIMSGGSMQTKEKQLFETGHQSVPVGVQHILIFTNHGKFLEVGAIRKCVLWFLVTKKTFRSLTQVKVTE